MWPFFPCWGIGSSHLKEKAAGGEDCLDSDLGVWFGYVRRTAAFPELFPFSKPKIKEVYASHPIVPRTPRALR